MDSVPLWSQGRNRKTRNVLIRPDGSWQWLQKHPLAYAVLWMLVGGGLVYFLMVKNAQRLTTAVPHETATASAASAPPSPSAAGAAAAAAATPSAAAQRAASTFLPAEAPAEQPLCNDSCYKAKDGICDDGRFVHNMTQGVGSRVLCDLGTDCSDCGAWHGRQHSNAWTESIGPIEYLRRANQTVLIKRSAVEPLLYLAYTDPAHDPGLSTQYGASGVIEPQLSHIAYHLLHGLCQKSDEGIMLDVGANFGWYSIMAATLGCRVIAWEPVPTLQAFFEYSIARNKLHDSIQVRPAAVVQHPSPPAVHNYTVVAPQRRFWATASVDGANSDLPIDHQGAYHKFNVTGETLDQVILPQALKQIAVLKVNVDGYEPRVLAGAEQLLQKQLLGNILLGYSPHVLERTSTADLDQMPRMLLSLLAAGFKLGHIVMLGLGDRGITSLSEPLQMLPAITETNLKFDLFDCIQMTENSRTWQQPPCPEMVQHKLISEGVPQRWHPKSFRSSFEMNTNVWASRDPNFMPYLQGPPVGAFPAERKVTDSWFIPEWSDSAMGGRSCRILQQMAADEGMTPAERAGLLVGHRCRCGSANPCELEEKIADGCAQAGKTPFSDNQVPDRRLL